MKRQTKTAIVLLLAMILLCGTGAGEEFILPTGSYFPLTESVTMTAWVVNALDSVSVSQSGVLGWIEEKTGIHLEIVRELKGAGAKQQLNLLMETEKTLPDILLCTRWTKAECLLYGQQGLILPLDDYLAQCENWNRLNTICGPDHISDLTMADGHIYCYGTVNECFHLTHQARMWVYQPWIDLLCGGVLPQTTEEFRAYLQAVAESDPNGNGLADEIPLTGQIEEGWATDPITFLSNAYVQNNAIFGSTNQTVASGCYVHEGQVHCNWTEDAYRDALAYIRDLYRKGLLHAQVFTQNGRQLSARIDAQPHLVGAVAGGYFPSLSDSELPEGTWSEWTCLPPLSGPDGTRLCYQSAYDYFYNCNGLLTRDCRYPEAAVQLFDLLASSEGTLVQNYGREGSEWVWCDADEGIGIDGARALYRFLWNGNSSSQESVPYWPADVQICSNSDLFRKGAMVQEGIFNGENELWKCAEMYDAFSPGHDSVYPNVALPLEESEKLFSYQAAIDQYVRQSTIDFVTGYMSLENDWEAYLSMLGVLGQKEYQALLQDALDHYMNQ